MFGNIKKNNVRGLGLKLRNDAYYDFMLYKGECYGNFDSSSCIIAGMDADTILPDGTWKSSYIWPKAVMDIDGLFNIGFTGIDNGLITYRKDFITNKDFLDIFTGSTLLIEDSLLTLHPVSGNTMRYSYPYEVVDDYIALKGGFFQGFYKIQGKDYEVLPHVLNSDWNIEIVLRRKDYDIPSEALITRYPENKGLFFYMGTRAENKFAIYYGLENFDGTIDSPNDYFADYDPGYENSCGNGYLCEDSAFNDDCDTPPFESDYFNTVPDWCKNNVYTSDGYFIGDYLGTDCEDGGAILDEYFLVDEDIDESLKDATTKDGYSLEEQEYDVYTTDNKFILFNRTNTGYTVDNWDDSIEGVKFVDVKRSDAPNKFNLMNRTETGYTTDTIDGYGKNGGKKLYNVLKDLTGNAFGVFVDDEGAVGYKYIISDCENGYSTIIEKGKKGVFPKDEWVTVNIRITPLNPSENACQRRNGKMKVMIYVNGNLCFVSRELPEFNFRGLDDVSSKQEGVPFNISVGGGTQGLIDGIWPKDTIVSDKHFPLMKYFGGSFIGDLKSFKFYGCFRDYQSIKTSVLS